MENYTIELTNEDRKEIEKEILHINAIIAKEKNHSEDLQNKEYIASYEALIAKLQKNIEDGKIIINY
jgi:transcription elongation GreA/GreB family factor